MHGALCVAENSDGCRGPRRADPGTRCGFVSSFERVGRLDRPADAPTPRSRAGLGGGRARSRPHATSEDSLGSGSDAAESPDTAREIAARPAVAVAVQEPPPRVGHAGRGTGPDREPEASGQFEASTREEFHRPRVRVIARRGDGDHPRTATALRDDDIVGRNSRRGPDSWPR